MIVSNHAADSGSAAARRGGCSRGWEESTACSPLLSSAGASSPLGLIKPRDPLLLIDFLIINSVCPSISLRRRISPLSMLRCYCAICGHRDTDEQISTTLIKNLTARVNLALNCCVTGFIMHKLRHISTTNTPARAPTCA